MQYPSPPVLGLLQLVLQVDLLAIEVSGRVADGSACDRSIWGGPPREGLSSFRATATHTMSAHKGLLPEEDQKMEVLMTWTWASTWTS